MPSHPTMGILQRALRKAAEETGNQDFARQADEIEARATPLSDERTVLQPMDRAAITEALDNPPQATERLKAAVERHGKTIISR
ncbi:DUF1778 domain-containing protein [Devosia sp.]|uniref:type II toxin -antitoxin system TacA 1-like antitoxin n=1 Tax=Devosia sp. TaxID=1871048 RepID=UPI002AFEF63F|nr:DUF1778 domain-containing protein [Devosia sp.]